MHSDAETTQLHRSGILLASQESTLRLQVTMNNVVLVAVTQRLEDLSHVVTVKERKCSFLEPASPGHVTKARPRTAENNSGSRGRAREANRAISPSGEDLNSAIGQHASLHRVMILSREILRTSSRPTLFSSRLRWKREIGTDEQCADCVEICGRYVTKSDLLKYKKMDYQ